MRLLIIISLMSSFQVFGQAANKVEGIKITSAVHVYLKEQNSEHYLKLSTDKQLADHFQKDTNKIYQYMDFLIDFEKQKKELKKIEGKIKEGDHYKINEHLKALNKKGINQFAVIFSMVEADKKRRTITLYDIKDTDSKDYKMLARVRLDAGENVSPEKVSNLFYLGMVTANQQAGMDKEAREFESSIEQIFTSLQINESLLTDLERKTKEIDDYPRAQRKESLANEIEVKDNNIVINQ